MIAITKRNVKLLAILGFGYIFSMMLATNLQSKLSFTIFLLFLVSFMMTILYVLLKHVWPSQYYTVMTKQADGNTKRSKCFKNIFTFAMVVVGAITAFALVVIWFYL